MVQQTWPNKQYLWLLMPVSIIFFSIHLIPYNQQAQIWNLPSIFFWNAPTISLRVKTITSGRALVQLHGRCHPSHLRATDRAGPHSRRPVGGEINFERMFISFSPLSLGLVSLLHRSHRPTMHLHLLTSPTSAPSSGSQWASAAVWEVKWFPLPYQPEQHPPSHHFDV